MLRLLFCFKERWSANTNMLLVRHVGDVWSMICQQFILHNCCDTVSRGVRNPMKISDIGFLKTEPNRPQNSKTENSVFAVRFSKNRLRRFGDGFSRCFIDSSSCSMLGSTVTVFFFMPYLCTSSSESLRPVNYRSTSFLASYTLNNTQCKKPNKKPKPQLI